MNHSRSSASRAAQPSIRSASRSPFAQGKVKTSAARRVWVCDPDFDDVEPAGVCHQAPRRDGSKIVRCGPAVEIGQTLGHESPDVCVGLDRLPPKNPPCDDLEVPDRLAP